MTNTIESDELEVLKWEYQQTHEICNRYFERLYRIVSFGLTAIAALFTLGFSIQTGNDDFGFILFSVVLPLCLLVLCVLYVYNGYTSQQRDTCIAFPFCN